MRDGTALAGASEEKAGGRARKSVLSRRAAFVALGSIAGAFLGGKVLSRGSKGGAGIADASGRDLANFRTIYGDVRLREDFKKFLVNVFHLYPEDEFDALIAECAANAAPDPLVYRRIEARLGEIEPTLGALRYSLPALRHQKDEMARQTAELLAGKKEYRGYLEIGSHGRYLDKLRSKVVISGEVYSTAIRGDGYGPVDVVDRGSLGLPGRVIPWRDYAPFSPSDVPDGSLELVTIYIGLHHAKEEQRLPYAASVYRAMAPGGRLVIRDHDVVDENLRHTVSLAHDVFNVGTKESFSTNDGERRNFYSLEVLTAFLREVGFEPLPGRLLQEGDPTRNTLLVFGKRSA